MNEQNNGGPSDDEIRRLVNLPFNQDENGTEWVTLTPHMLARAVRRALATTEQAAPAVPQVWKLVPVEPTPEMLAAVSWPGCARTDWSHMLAAAPAAPSQKPGKCAQCKKPYRKGANTEGCPKCAPGVVVPESEFQKPISSQEPAPTGCNCRWDGDTQVQWCELHLAHKDAIHEWAERAKTAEAKLAQLSTSQKPVTLTDRQFDLICQAIDKADTITMEGDYMMASGDCIAVVRVMQALFSIAAPSPEPVTLTHEEIRDALEAEFLGEASNRVWEDDLRISLAIIAALREKGGVR